MLLDISLLSYWITCFIKKKLTNECLYVTLKDSKWNMEYVSVESRFKTASKLNVTLA